MSSNWLHFVVIMLSLCTSIIGVLLNRFIHARHFSLEESHYWENERNHLIYEMGKIRSVSHRMTPKKTRGHTCPHCGGMTATEPCEWCGGYWEQGSKRKETNPDIFLKTQKARIEKKAMQGYPQALPLLAHYDLARTPDYTMSLLEETEKFLLWSD